jgi:Fe2+ or Zn2+ uptake regulation protein
MGTAERQRRLEALEERCHDAGLPVTIQRRVIFEALLGLDTHPTADQVHAEVARHRPGISRTTVYRTLETLVRSGLITRACHPGSAVRYDMRTEVHHHLICLHCDEVIDIQDERLDKISLPDTSAFGFDVSEHRVQLRGRCKRCRQEEER